MNPQEYRIVSFGRLIFFSSENNVQRKSNNFMKNVMHLLNLCVNQFLLYKQLIVQMSYLVFFFKWPNFSDSSSGLFTAGQISVAPCVAQCPVPIYMYICICLYMICIYYVDVYYKQTWCSRGWSTTRRNRPR